MAFGRRASRHPPTSLGTTTCYLLCGTGGAASEYTHFFVPFHRLDSSCSTTHPFVVVVSPAENCRLRVRGSFTYRPLRSAQLLQYRGRSSWQQYSLAGLIQTVTILICTVCTCQLFSRFCLQRSRNGPWGFDVPKLPKP